MSCLKKLREIFYIIQWNLRWYTLNPNYKMSHFTFETFILLKPTITINFFSVILVSWLQSILKIHIKGWIYLHNPCNLIHNFVGEETKIHLIMFGVSILFFISCWADFLFLSFHFLLFFPIESGKGRLLTLSSHWWGLQTLARGLLARP